MFAVRVLVRPNTRALQGGSIVTGGTLSLLSLGAGGGSLASEQAKPATLKFYGRHLSNPRDMPPDFEEFAKLSGKLVRSNVNPQFKAAENARIEYSDGSSSEDDSNTGDPSDDDSESDPSDDEAKADDSEPAFLLQLDYDESTFPNIAAGARRLRLPAEPDGSRYFELGLGLEVDGDAEATPDVNAILDLPTAGLGVFDATLADANGDPLGGQAFTLEFPDGTRVDGTADESGHVRVEPVPKGLCMLYLRRAEPDNEGASNG